MAPSGVTTCAGAIEACRLPQQMTSRTGRKTVPLGESPPFQRPSINAGQRFETAPEEGASSARTERISVKSIQSPFALRSRPLLAASRRACSLENRPSLQRWVACRQVPALIVYMAATLLTACAPPGRPAESDRPLRPAEVKDFAQLYGDNCAGCHGANGTLGPSLPLDHPVYLAWVDDAALRRVIAAGVPGTAMPGFGKAAGGSLTDEQIKIVVDGLRTRWAKPGVLAGVVPPPYATDGAGNAQNGGGVYATYCASCHGADGKGGAQIGSIVDGSYLALVSDQWLRTITVAGRPDLHHPDWRGYVQGQPMTASQVSDVVAWLAARRQPFPGQPYAQNQ